MADDSSRDADVPQEMAVLGADKLGKISKIDRPVLGSDVPLVVFRAFRLYSSDYMARIIGRGTEAVLQHGGRELGKEVGASLLKPTLDAYLAAVQQWVRDSRIGLLKLASLDDRHLVVQLDECITCAGMDNLGMRICFFEVGLVAGVVEAFLKKKVRAKETRCNAAGEGTCEATVMLS